MFVVCTKWIGDMFTKGKLYKVDGGLIKNNNGVHSTEFEDHYGANFRYAYKNEVKGL